MIPIVFGLGGLIARVAAVAVIPRLAKALSAAFSPPSVAPPLESGTEPEATLGGEKQHFSASLHPRSYPINVVDPEGTIGGPVAGGVIAVGVGVYLAARTLSRFRALSRKDWQSQADDLISNSNQFNVDQKELKDVLDYYRQNYSDMLDYHCPYAQDRLFRIMSARFTNLKTIRFQKGFVAHGSVMVNPDNVVQLVPTKNGPNVSRILLYSGTDGGAPLRLGNPESVNPWPNTQSAPLWWPTPTWWPAGMLGE